ncbi:hypothetical protein CROQUDRAFT_673770 [Cronartium quercuum f. sp. fusiforme G11]|uniref:GDT1 family protein n=1 Tax=Cronartium quercuum f. sp. fusiforme G11 TaxID=708437 RepID=A0A9P6N9E1_9BASI|nr:hypothetical protein CROQUDRAFT_673770 [Cronartium quercuum f. sp. fusiforme G11]
MSTITSIEVSTTNLTSYLPTLAGLDRAIVMIVVSEIGDKTFLLAALLAMRHSRLVIFLGAFSALLVMSILSAGLGHILPTLISRRYTVLAASALFLVFGSKMLHEGLIMESGTGKVQEELKEVEDEIREKEVEMDHMTAEVDLIEQGKNSNHRILTGKHHKRSKSKSTSTKTTGLKNLFYLLLSPVFVQTFIMTFLAEWGDRSQISTIALGAAHSVYLVCIGTVLGHAFCTFLAVMGGRWLATKISVKQVTLGGAVLFLVFGILYLYEGWAWDELEANISEMTTTTVNYEPPKIL